MRKFLKHHNSRSLSNGIFIRMLVKSLVFFNYTMTCQHINTRLGTMGHTCSLKAGKAETRGSEIQGHLRLYSKF